MKKLKKFIVVGTGLQAPYGIGEFIADTNSIKKAKKIAAGWYNQPAVITREEFLAIKEARN